MGVRIVLTLLLFLLSLSPLEPFSFDLVHELEERVFVWEVCLKIVQASLDFNTFKLPLVDALNSRSLRRYHLSMLTHCWLIKLGHLPKYFCFNVLKFTTLRGDSNTMSLLNHLCLSQSLTTYKNSVDADATHLYH